MATKKLERSRAPTKRAAKYRVPTTIAGIRRHEARVVSMMERRLAKSIAKRVPRAFADEKLI